MEALLTVLTELEQAPSGGDWVWLARAWETAQALALVGGEIQHSEFTWLRTVTAPLAKGFAEAAAALEGLARSQQKTLASNLDLAQAANQNIGDPTFVPQGPVGWLYLAYNRADELRDTVFLPAPTPIGDDAA